MRFASLEWQLRDTSKKFFFTGFSGLFFVINTRFKSNPGTGRHRWLDPFDKLHITNLHRPSGHEPRVDSERWSRTACSASPSGITLASRTRTRTAVVAFVSSLWNTETKRTSKRILERCASLVNSRATAATRRTLAVALAFRAFLRHAGRCCRLTTTRRNRLPTGLLTVWGPPADTARSLLTLLSNRVRLLSRFRLLCCRRRRCFRFRFCCRCCCCCCHSLLSLGPAECNAQAHRHFFPHILKRRRKIWPWNFNNLQNIISLGTSRMNLRFLTCKQKYFWKKKNRKS